MGNNRTFLGKEISQEDVEMIQWIVSTYRTLSRSELAATVSESLGWVQHDGKAKTGAGMACLIALEEEGLVCLPEKDMVASRRSAGRTMSYLDISEQGEIRSCGLITLDPVKDSQESILWRSYVKKYHMLGHKKVYGSQMRYFIRSDGTELGCMQFSASAWALASRDKWIGWTEEDRKVRLDLVVNNSRYLLFPWVKVTNLASRALGLATRQIQGDWLKTFGYAPVLLETFVDTEHFRGTCYKAANWILLGHTDGRGRNDRYTKRELSRKAVFVYPLQKDFREVLTGLNAVKEMEI